MKISLKKHVFLFCMPYGTTDLIYKNNNYYTEYRTLISVIIIIYCMISYLIVTAGGAAAAPLSLSVWLASALYGTQFKTL